MTTKDPVCGMPIEPAHAVGCSQFEGVTYHFCCADCQRDFEANPGLFTAEGHARPMPCCGFGMGMVRRTTQRGSA